MRESGYYFVVHKGKSKVAEWDRHLGMWFLTRRKGGYNDNAFTSINEAKLQEPK